MKCCCLKALKSSYQTHTQRTKLLSMMYQQQHVVVKKCYNIPLSLEFCGVLGLTKGISVFISSLFSCRVKCAFKCESSDY